MSDPLLLRCAVLLVPALAACPAPRPAAPSEPAVPDESRSIELPPSLVEAAAPVAPGWQARPAHPGVGAVRRCHTAGADDPPIAALVQASSDPARDQALLAERVSRRSDEAPGPDLVCDLVAHVVLPPLPSTGPVPARTVIPPNALDRHRANGDKDIRPSVPIRERIATDGRGGKLAIPVKVCIDTAGRVDQIAVVKSSGYYPYDLDLVNTIASWSYRPYEDNGVPAPVCSIVMFIYKQV